MLTVSLMTDANLASDLVAWRKSLNLSQKEACSVLDVPLRTYQSWEEGAAGPAKICTSCVRNRMASQKDKAELAKGSIA